MNLIVEHDPNTPEGQMAIRLEQILRNVNQTYRNLKNGGNAISSLIFSHPTLPAQAIIDAIGNTPENPVAAGLMAAARGTADILSAISGREQLVIIPNNAQGLPQRVEIDPVTNVVTIVTG